MFNLVYYTSDTVHMGVSWFGLGRLYAIDRKRQGVKYATLRQKAFVYSVGAAAKKSGMDFSPSNAAFQEMKQQLTEDVLYCASDGYMWAALYLGGPEEYAQRYLP